MELVEARQEIQQLLESKTFESSETHRRLLEYLANKSLSGATDHLKEYTIGVEAFGKPASYDPQEDSIVRTQISRLRLKLHEYYNLEGKEDPVWVEIPKGSFRLDFHFRDADAAALLNNRSTPTLTAVASSIGLKPAALPWTLSGILAIVCIFLAYNLLAVRDNGKVRAPWLLSRVLNARQQTTIVLADAGFSRLQNFTGRSTTLEEYLSSDYPIVLSSQQLTAREAALFDVFTRWPVVSQAEAETLKTLVGLSGPLESRIYVRSARDLRARDLTDGNAILLGSASSNPWVTRFLKFLNFKLIDEHKNGNRYFLNQGPKPGELATYVGLTRTGSDGWAYGTVSLVPNERSNGGVLILQGLQREGTVAAGLLMADEKGQAELRRTLTGAGEDPDKAWFEVLVRAESIGAVPGKIQIVAVRVVHPS